MTRIPSIFFRFADSAVDPAPDYDSPNAVRIEWGLSGLRGPDRRSELLELITCLKEMLGGTFTDEELNRFWWASNATVKYSDPKLLRELLEEAVTIIDRELG